MDEVDLDLDGLCNGFSQKPPKEEKRRTLFARKLSLENIPLTPPRKTPSSESTKIASVSSIPIAAVDDTRERSKTVSVGANESFPVKSPRDRNQTMKLPLRITAPDSRKAVSSNNVIEAPPLRKAVSELGRPHRFCLTLTWQPRDCGYCHRPRATLKSYKCHCGLTVHKRCINLITSECPMPPASRFQISQSFFRDLEKVDLTNGLSGLMYKKSKSKKWKQFFFLLSNNNIYYFGPNVSAFQEALPKGGWSLSSCHVVEVNEEVSRLSPRGGNFCFELGGEYLDRKVVLAAPNASSRMQWIEALKIAISEQNNELVASNVWDSCVMFEGYVIKEIAAHEQLKAIMLCEQRTGLCEKTTCIDADKCNSVYHVELESIENAPGLKNYFVEIKAMYNGKPVVPKKVSTLSMHGVWEETLLLSSVYSLPCETVLRFTVFEVSQASSLTSVFGWRDSKYTRCAGHVHLTLCDVLGRMRTGSHRLRVTEGEPTFQLSFSHDYDNLREEDQEEPLFLKISLPEPPFPVVYTSFPMDLFFCAPDVPKYDPMPKEERQKLEKVISDTKNPLEAALESTSRSVVWSSRDRVQGSLLPQTLTYCDFTSPIQRDEACELTRKSLTDHMLPSIAFHLMSFCFSSVVVRFVAMHAICKGMNDDELAEHMLSITHALFSENHVWSPMVNLLLMRCSGSEKVAHSFFWTCHGLENPKTVFGSRFIAYSKVLLSYFPQSFCETLVQDCFFVDSICKISSNKQRDKELNSFLAGFKNMEEVRCLPTGPNCTVKGVDLEKCSVLNSSAAPIYVSFIPESPDVHSNYEFIFKSGDDLRHDELMMMMGKLFNEIWEAKNIKARLQLYHVVSLGDCKGMIEVVPNCCSLGKVQDNSVINAFAKSPITTWLKQNKSQSWEQVTETFAQTLAGACVFEYIMGIGDRHADNFLISTDGSIFHIDFGMIFGHDYGVAGKAKVPFTLHAQMADVLGGKEGLAFQNFKILVCNAYEAIRERHVEISSTVLLACASGLRDLSKKSELEYVLRCLGTKMTRTDAISDFKRKLEASLETKRANWNDSLHRFHIKYLARPSTK